MFLWIGIILLAAWALGFFVFSLGAIIHIALIVALIAIVWHFVSGATRTHNG